MVRKTANRKKSGAKDAATIGEAQSPVQEPRSRAVPRFLDIEASSLEPGGVPIEVAWSDVAGAVHSLCLDPSAFGTSFHWSGDAENLHGMSEDFLRKTGVSPAEVAKALNASLWGAVVYSDGIQFDQEWLAHLYKAARAAPTFKLVDAWSLFAARVLAAYEEAGLTIGPRRDTLAYDIETYVEDLRSTMLDVHRAGPDVAFLLRVYAEIGEALLPGPRPSRKGRHGT